MILKAGRSLLKTMEMNIIRGFVEVKNIVMMRSFYKKV